MIRAVLLVLLVLLAACDERPGCPEHAPSAGEQCTAAIGFATCDYGGDDHGQCRTYATCETGSGALGAWSVTSPGSSCEAHAASCPATYGDMEGTACSNAPDCEYPEGLCGCISCSTGTGAVGGLWHCRPWSDVGPGCPTVPPYIGDRCDQDGLSCDYQQCCGGPSFGEDLVCKDGFWHQTISGACECTLPRCS